MAKNYYTTEEIIGKLRQAQYLYLCSILVPVPHHWGWKSRFKPPIIRWIELQIFGFLYTTTTQTKTA